MRKKADYKAVAQTIVDVLQEGPDADQSHAGLTWVARDTARIVSYEGLSACG
jgi:hypothetical protein